MEQFSEPTQDDLTAVTIAEQSTAENDAEGVTLPVVECQWCGHWPCGCGG